MHELDEPPRYIVSRAFRDPITHRTRRHGRGCGSATGCCRRQRRRLGHTPNLGPVALIAQGAEAHDDYRNALVHAAEPATVRTQCFDGMWPDAPHGVSRNSTYDRCDAAGCRSPGHGPGKEDVTLMAGDMMLESYSMVPPGVRMPGEPGAAAMYAGCGVGRIHDCPPVADVMKNLASLIGN